MSKSNKNSGSDQFAPKPGTRYNPPPAQPARHTTESLPGNPITSKQPASKYPSVATSSDNARAKELLKPWKPKVDR